MLYRILHLRVGLDLFLQAGSPEILTRGLDIQQKEMPMPYRRLPSSADIVASQMYRRGVELDPLRLEEKVAAQREREQIENREHLQAVRSAASAVVKAKRAYSVELSMLASNPTDANRRAAVAAKADRDLAVEQLRELLSARRGRDRFSSSSGSFAMNGDRALCGLATTYGQPSANDGRVWTPEHFREFIDLEVGIPLRVDHGPLLNSRGFIANIGTVRRFASVIHPTPGLLILAEIDHAEGYGDQLLADIALMCQQSWLPPGWSLSVGALVYDESLAIPHEISVVRRPAHPDARILSVGKDAIESWALLTEMPRR